MELDRLRLTAASSSAFAISSVSMDGRMMPYSLVGAISCIPPISVAIAAVLHAAASSNTVEKPSERDGKQKKSACSSKAARSFLLSMPGVITAGQCSFLMSRNSGPSPAIMVKRLQLFSLAILVAFASCKTPFSGTNRPALTIIIASSGISNSSLKLRALAPFAYSSALMEFGISPYEVIEKWESHSLAFFETA